MTVVHFVRGMLLCRTVPLPLHISCVGLGSAAYHRRPFQGQYVCYCMFFLCVPLFMYVIIVYVSFSGTLWCSCSRVPASALWSEQQQEGHRSGVGEYFVPHLSTWEGFLAVSWKRKAAVADYEYFSCGFPIVWYSEGVAMAVVVYWRQWGWIMVGEVLVVVVYRKQCYSTGHISWCLVNHALHPQGSQRC